MQVQARAQARARFGVRAEMRDEGQALNASLECKPRELSLSSPLPAVHGAVLEHHQRGRSLSGLQLQEHL